MYDVKNLGKMKTLGANAPEAMSAFVAFDKAALADGAIPRKYKELIALGVAFTTQCPYCIDIHSNSARAGRIGSGDCRDRARGGGVARRRSDHPCNPRHEVRVTAFGTERE